MLINSINTFYSTVLVQKCSSANGLWNYRSSKVALFSVNLRNIGATLYLDSIDTILITRNLPRNFFKSLKTDSKRFQIVQTYPSMSLRTFVNVIKLILHNLENTEFFDGIPYNMLINSINTFYSTVWVPKRISIILCQFEELWSNALP